MTTIDGPAPLELVALAAQSRILYTGVCLEGGPGRVFGGQVLAQAMCAVSQTIDDRRPIHSLHASFVGPAAPGIPLEYGTEVIKSGRAFDVVEFRARQSGKVTLVGFTSAHEGEPSVGFSQAAPAVLDAEELPRSSFTPAGANPTVRSYFDRRYLPSSSESAEQNVWVRTRRHVDSDSRVVHSALLAYAVDFLLTRSAHVRLPKLPSLGASLDHSMWFHRGFRIDEWLLISNRVVSFSDSRSLCLCSVFERSGLLVASASQEALIRSNP